ncbi:MAG: hypothetical protein D6702_09165, partial [Planctomycetota bacterium]
LLALGCGGDADPGAASATAIETAGPAPAERVATALAALRSAPPPARPPAEEVLAVHRALAAGDLARARELSAALLARSPEDPEAALARGIVLFLSGSYGNARPLLEQALAAAPGFPGADRILYFYGSCLTRLGDGAGARAALEGQLELLPEDGDTLVALGELDLQEGRTEEALDRFERARPSLATEQERGIPVQASLARLEAGAGAALLQLGRVEEAAAALEHSVQLDPSRPETWYALSRARLRLGDLEGASRAVGRFRALSPPR